MLDWFSAHCSVCERERECALNKYSFLYFYPFTINPFTNPFCQKLYTNINYISHNVPSLKTEICAELPRVLFSDPSFGNVMDVKLKYMIIHDDIS